MRRRKQKGLFDKLSNIVLLLLFVVITTWGIQVTNAETSGLRFAHVSDAHYSSNGTNTLYRLSKESPDLLEDAISQINDTENLDFVMFTGDQINTPYEKELRKFIDVANKIKYPWYFEKLNIIDNQQYGRKNEVGVAIIFSGYLTLYISKNNNEITPWLFDQIIEKNIYVDGFISLL